MKTPSFVWTLFVVLLCSSCCSVDKHRVSYLQNTGQLQPDPQDKHAMVARTTTSATQFSAVKINSIAFVAPDSKLTPEQQAAIKQRLETALNERFQKNWPGRPNGQVLEIRGAITGVAKANVPLNVLTEAAINFPVDMGGVAVDLEAVGPGGKRIAAGQYTVAGKPWQMFSSLSETAQAKHGADDVADKFYTLVTGQKPPPAATTSHSFL